LLDLNHKQLPIIFEPLQPLLAATAMAKLPPDFVKTD
jgi:hypothetical protein